MNTTKLVLTATILAILSFLLSLDKLHVFFTDHEAPHDKLQRVEVLPLHGAIGPESLAFDADGGGPYTGVSDGSILKWQGKEHGWLEFAVSSPHLINDCRGSKDPKREHVCGRPLGLRFNEKTGALYIADAYSGLLMKGLDDKFAKPIATEAQGLPFGFTNGLDIDQESGVVYFTDSSINFQRREFVSAIISGDKTGRLMKYDPQNKEVEVLLDGLSFPNGVVLSKDGSFLLIAETTTCGILRYGLHSPKGTGYQVLTQLPGFPDNIKRSPRGGFWVALHSRRGKLVERALSLPWLREVLLSMPFDIQRVPSFLSRWRGGRQGLALRLSEKGEVLQVLEGFGGRAMRHISEVQELNDTLWIGSVVMPFVVAYSL